MIKLITSARDIDSFISICQIQGKMKMNESHTRRKWPLWMTSSLASWPCLTSPMIQSARHGTNTEKILEMNTLGVSSSCMNYASGGLPLHTHLRAAELIFMFYGMLNIGFVTRRSSGLPMSCLMACSPRRSRSPTRRSTKAKLAPKKD